MPLPKSKYTQPGKNYARQRLLNQLAKTPEERAFLRRIDNFPLVRGSQNSFVVNTMEKYDGDKAFINKIKNPDGFFSEARSNDGIIHQFELLYMELRDFSRYLTEQEKAMLPKIWERMETLSTDANKSIQINAPLKLEPIELEKNLQETKKKVSSKLPSPANIETEVPLRDRKAAKRLQLVYDSDNNPSTLSQKDLENLDMDRWTDWFSYHGFTRSERNSLESLWRLMKKSDQKIVSTKGTITVPEPSFEKRDVGEIKLSNGKKVSISQVMTTQVLERVYSYTKSGTKYKSVEATRETGYIFNLPQDTKITFKKLKNPKRKLDLTPTLDKNNETSTMSLTGTQYAVIEYNGKEELFELNFPKTKNFKWTRHTRLTEGETVEVLADSGKKLKKVSLSSEGLNKSYLYEVA